MHQIVIIKSDGTKTSLMSQPQAEHYLGNLLRRTGRADRIANLRQALNDITGGKGKPTGAYHFKGTPVLHASSGIMGVKSVSLFYYDHQGDHYIIAMGEHIGSTAYKLTFYGQPSGDFAEGKTISLA